MSSGASEMKGPASNCEDEHFAGHGQVDGGAEVIAFDHPPSRPTPQERGQKSEKNRGGQGHYDCHC